MKRCEKVDPDRTEVLQDVLDAEQCRQWWADQTAPVFGGAPIGEEAVDDDEAPEAPLVFRGLFGEIPGSETAPIPIQPRRRSA